MVSSKLKSFLNKAKEIGTIIKELSIKNNRLLVVCHFDADGLAAGGILSKALLRWGASIHFKVVKQLDENVLKSFQSIDKEVIIFSEIGSGYLELIEKHLEGSIFVLDHHPPDKISPAKVTHLNPADFGYNGSVDISGAGVNYCVVKETDTSNIDLASLAVVGALGDMQDKNKQRKLLEINEYIVEDGIRTGALQVERDLIFFGRETRPIHKALASTTSPFLPGLTGREDVCISLLSSAGVTLKNEDKWRTLASLSQEEKKNLISKIVKHLTSHGVQGDIVQNLIGTIYTLSEEDKGSILRDAREFSSILNACGRMDKSGLGIAICLGDREASLKELEDLGKKYKQTLAKHMEWVTQNPNKIQKLKVVNVIRGEDFIDGNLVGAIASMISASNLLEKNKPLIVVSKPKNGIIKISARASKNIVNNGLRLGELLSNLSKKFSQLGGGHDVAAGAQISKEQLEEYLRDLDKEAMARISR